ncbi:ABC transporter permease [Solibacillus sp. CAU 1738]|uniref:ABC transporter permease n=1 Tax=Solibacillus sp. CAU 1738 TaxID=3140363 RepID=UPI0032604A5F
MVTVAIYKRELLKLFKRSPFIWGISLYVIFLIYCYVNVGLQFQQSFNSFLENSSFSVQQTLNYLATADISDPLRNPLHVVSPSNAIGYSLAIVNSFGPWFIAIIAAFLFGIEYRHQTVKQLRSRRMTKVEILLGKIFSIATIIVLFLSICIVTGYIMSFITPRIFDMPVDIISNEQIMLDQSLLQIVGTFISLFLWGIFTAFITVITKSLFTGIIIGIAYPIIESLFLHDLSFSEYLPLYIQKSMLPILFEKSSGDMISFHPLSHIYSLNESIFYTLLYISLFIIMLLFVLKKQKVSIL